MALAGVLLGLGGCAQPVREGARETLVAPAEFPGGLYEQAAARGQAVWRVDAACSVVAVTVRRGGSLARLGHDHVVVSHEVQGYVAPEEGRADFYVPVGSLTVDEPAFRAEAGLDTQPGEADIAGTRTNMLDHVLEAKKFPFAVLEAKETGKSPTGLRLALTLTLHGVSRTFDVPAQTSKTGGTFAASGLLEFDQSDFGITPFSILGGAIQVKDRLSLRFDIRARPAGEAASTRNAPLPCAAS